MKDSIYIFNKSTKEKRRIKLKKNIDTFKDENEPDIRTKLGNIKNIIGNNSLKQNRTVKHHGAENM